MTYIFTPKPGEEEKWREQATKAGAHLKSLEAGKEIFKIGFAFDDGFVTVEVRGEDIRRCTAEELGDLLYKVVLEAARNGKKKVTLH